CQQESDWSLTF
nr:immunoglobulin light chain junction region [Macaca mulatta]MOV35222.1 immunoglobulin light chain junction region [Macaca mulatta]MOV35423.1 immunoglobulin light chain junction region [Macaca mulatta]MOV61195.1 immunoglobulin light chain junction region [Macaca mulatta]MOV61652.1 immunoglobulin light chain junction region [Macaca mulatta]